MGLRINTNVAALSSGRILNRSTESLNTTLKRLGSGLRINSAKDDAAGLAIAEGFRSQVLGTNVAARNSQDGVSLAQTAEGSLSETTNILQRARVLAVQAANGTVSTENRTSLNNEVKELVAQIDSIAWNTEFNGIKVLSSGQKVTLQTGANAGQTLVVSTSGAASAALGVSTLSITSMANATAALSTLDIAIRSVTSIRATLGAQQNRLEFTINTLAIQEENAAASESAIRDADIARETINFTRTQILVSAGTTVLAQANLVPQTALSLLG